MTVVKSQTRTQSFEQESLKDPFEPSLAELVREAELSIFRQPFLVDLKRQVRISQSIKLPDFAKSVYPLPEDFVYQDKIFCDGVEIPYFDFYADQAEYNPVSDVDYWYMFYVHAGQRYILILPQLPPSPFNLLYWAGEPSINAGWDEAKGDYINASQSNKYSELYPTLYIYYISHLVYERDGDMEASGRMLQKFNEALQIAKDTETNK